jgi:hypothetical protein
VAANPHRSGDEHLYIEDAIPRGFGTRRRAWDDSKPEPARGRKPRLLMTNNYLPGSLTVTV